MPIDRDRPVRRVIDLTALARDVVAAGEHDEPTWIEWKGSLDLEDKRDLVSLARHVLGLSNRDPDRARQHAGGCGYVFVGVEPGHVSGIQTIDLADLEPRLLAYLGEEGPRWSLQWLKLEGHDVLAVVVDTPAPGDPIHTLNREYDRYRDGTVFVRRPGRTVQATTADMRMLQRRLMAGSPDRRLQVALEPEIVTVRPVDLDESAVDDWIERERSRLLGPLARDRAEDPEEIGGRPGTSVDALIQAASAMDAVQRAALGQRLIEEDRTEEEYRSVVGEYLDEARAALQVVAIDKHIESGDCLVQLRMTNGTDFPFTDVRLDLYLPGEHFYATEGASNESLPKQPRIWGDRWESLASSFGSRFPHIDPSTYVPPDVHAPFVEIDNSGSASLAFSSVDLAPHDTVELAPFNLVAGSTLTSARIEGEWTARSTAVDGLSSGHLSIELTSEPARFASLIKGS